MCARCAGTASLIQFTLPGTERKHWNICFAILPAPGPGIILLDLRLPKVDGLEVSRQIRATRSDEALPVAVLTSSEDEMDALVSQGCGADAILAKPLEFQHFRDVLQALGLESLIAGRRAGAPRRPRRKENEWRFRCTC